MKLFDHDCSSFYKYHSIKKSTLLGSVEDKGLISFPLGSLRENFLLIFGFNESSLVSGLNVLVAGFKNGTKIILNFSFNQLDICILQKLLQFIAS